MEDIIPGFGPEEFLEDSNHGRRYTFGLCVYSGGDVETTLVVTDPSAATRTLTRYLPDSKSAALVTTSPLAPGGFVPSPGWCGDDDPTAIG